MINLNIRLLKIFIIQLGAQYMNLYTLKGTSGREAAEGTGSGLGPSSMPLPGPS